MMPINLLTTYLTTDLPTYLLPYLLTYLPTYLITYIIYFSYFTCLRNYLLTYLFTHSTMEQSPSWEANRFSASQEFPHIFMNPTVHYRIHKCPPPVSILSKLYPVHNPHVSLLKIALNNNLPSMPGSHKWSLSLTFPHQIPVYGPTLHIRTAYPAHPILLDFIARTVLGEVNRSQSTTSLSTVYCLYCRQCRWRRCVAL